MTSDSNTTHNDVVALARAMVERGLIMLYPCLAGGFWITGYHALAMVIVGLWAVLIAPVACQRFVGDQHVKD